jgi:hypothetical protein
MMGKTDIASMNNISYMVLNYKIFLFLYTLNREYVNGSGIVLFYSEIVRILRFERTGKSFCHMSSTLIESTI